ncbi:prolyl oligopeptidase family serine peptidase [Roseomonas sp. NAR14]|uniref:Prolyl oligopeptidase family serine peptidase n=1 Tax=Roseomonas acroporae TaxID=2937791 RepID=A0A9X1YFG8_9PROT|nr:prolyl oligopeptidase family serine peptidase [Roseomonas acroporae]MCK8787913.1 prolyl oligopeptidase family serine peptidase [Roseomonas acroporae]
MPDESGLPDLARPDDDPRLWLEEIEGARALDWVARQNAATLAAFAGPRLDADREALRAALDQPDRVPYVTRRGGLLYNFWKDAARPRGLWRRTTLDSYRTDDPDWEVLLDLDALSAAEGADWVWQGAATLPGRHDRAMLRLSRGGGDAVVLREYDLAARAFVPGGFAAPEAKGGVDWIDRDTLLLSSALGEGMATASGYPRTVRLWRRGEDPLATRVLHEVGPEMMGLWGGVDREVPGRLVFAEQLGFYDQRVRLGDESGPTTLLDLPTDARATWQRGWLAVRRRGEWTVGGRTHAPDTVLGIRLDDFLAGGRDFTVLFVPGPRRAIQGFFWCDGALVLSVLDDLRPVFTRHRPGDGGWTAEPIGGLPTIGVVSVWPLDAEAEESDGTLLVEAQDPVTPPSLLLAPPGLPMPALLKRSPVLFHAAGLAVTRHEAVSVDGERIPYFQVGPEGGPTGEAPVHLTGYGGFRVSSLPTYMTRTGKLWLERGGTAVVANIRGGGEFGTAWHEAGRLALKARSHDDFAAVADDLVKRGVTRPGRIAAEGGSNGGLLIANMLVRYPERFGALFCTIPLIDMRRYTRLLAGASWIAEYGDPEKPEDWAFLQHVSAYHLAGAGRPYPPILLATTRRDDRVHPGHARKMAAKLQELGHDARFHEPEAGGHGFGKDNAEVAAFAALGAAFLRRAIGWEAPEAG